MNIELIAIGDEVLLGFTVNSNACFLANQLLQAGYSVVHHEVIPDDKSMMKNTIENALKRRSCVIVTGGLGPTCDDLTREVVTEIFHRKLVCDQSLLSLINERFHHPSTAENQATIPEGAYLLTNHYGTASGLVLRDEALYPGAMLVCLPGVPIEMSHMCVDYLIPLLKTVPNSRKMFVYPIHCALLKEAEVDPLLRDFSKAGVSLGIYPAQGTLTVHLKKEAASYEQFLKEIDPIRKAIVHQFHKNIFESKSGKIEEAVHDFLIEKKLTMATAESCTGGALAARFVALDGASTYYKGSVIAYSNEIKKAYLGVSDELLKAHGAVSEEVTRCMAQSVCKNMGTDIGVAVSGIFGPTGGTAQKPVGTVCATIALKNGISRSWTMHLTPHRELNRDRCIIFVISEMLLFLRLNF